LGAPRENRQISDDLCYISEKFWVSTSIDISSGLHVFAPRWFEVRAFADTGCEPPPRLEASRADLRNPPERWSLLPI
jgi:hypothetical protein